jgi:hypothetical protein
MRARRKFARPPASANVVSLAAFREARARAAGSTAAAAAAISAPQDEVGLYWRWLALTGAIWTLWW